jgi:hypothetical protein
MTGLPDEVTRLRTDVSLTGGTGRGAGRAKGEANPPRVLKQRFVLDEKLGSGGMGTVFRAKDLRKVEARDSNPFVAVKVLNNDFREHPEAFIALQREAAKSQALAHRSIVTIHDFDKDGDVPFIIMELLEGQELSQLLRAYPTGLPDDMAWSIIRCLCDALEHAHDAGLVHADFKPQNVFVAPNHTAKILDFGIARAVQVNQAQGEETVFDSSRLAALTPAYASAEMLDGSEAEIPDDLFSLGVVIYLVLTGQHPYARVPANQAASEGLVPERPRRLSRRQWRVLERCLAFERAERPASVAQIKRQLLMPSPWRSRTSLVAALVTTLAVGLTIAVSGVKEGAAVEEAKTEVRQSTLMDAQIARLAALADAPEFDPAWEAKVGEEIAQLRTLLAPGAGEPEVLAQIRRRFREEIAATEDPDLAIALFQRALPYGAQPEALAGLEWRLTGAVTALLDAPALTPEWLDALETALGRSDLLLAEAPALAALRIDSVDVLTAELERSLAAARLPAARRALTFLEQYSFEPETVETLQNRVAEAERDLRAREAARQLEADNQRFRDELTAALTGACVRLDPAEAAAVLGRWTARIPAAEAAGRELAGQHIGRCMAQLEAADRDRAVTLKQRSEALFGALPGVGNLREDPCGAAYLVGSGSQAGRRGSCADLIGAGSDDGRAAGADPRQGPRLVVLPATESETSLAVTRQEISWAEFNVFCRSTGRCQPAAQGQDDLPVIGVPVTLALEYADWLSARTGFNYRLPTHAEWLRAAAGTDDPNRNCQVQLGSVRRGVAPVAAAAGSPNRFGLVNVLGNVQEWVLVAGELMAAGGAFRDPIAECAVETLRPHDGAADPATGFRLVREVT